MDEGRWLVEHRMEMDRAEAVRLEKLAEVSRRGHCRFPGCRFTHTDVHHILSWEDGGLTDIDNGMSACPRHHHKVHVGFTVSGDPNGELRFYRPEGFYFGSTYPATSRVAVW